MQALTVDQYAELRRLARSWECRYLRQAKELAGYNPRLGVDALCFSSISLEASNDYLLGALITPLSLSLMMVSTADSGECPAEGTVRWVRLPSGEYPLTPLSLAGDDWIWCCELLDDLSDVESLQLGSRLAQRLMTSVMTESSD